MLSIRSPLPFLVSLICAIAIGLPPTSSRLWIVEAHQRLQALKIVSQSTDSLLPCAATIEGTVSLERLIASFQKRDRKEVPKVVKQLRAQLNKVFVQGTKEILAQEYPPYLLTLFALEAFREDKDYENINAEITLLREAFTQNIRGAQDLVPYVGQPYIDLIVNNWSADFRSAYIGGMAPLHFKRFLMLRKALAIKRSVSQYRNFFYANLLGRLWAEDSAKSTSEDQVQRAKDEAMRSVRDAEAKEKPFKIPKRITQDPELFARTLASNPSLGLVFRDHIRRILEIPGHDRSRDVPGFALYLMALDDMLRDNFRELYERPNG